VTWLLYKSVGIEALGETLRDTTGTLVALQRQPRPGELEAFMKAVGRPIADFTAFNDELGGMLALLSLLDDYLGVSRTIMHLRVAVGQTARVLVPNPAEWRWMGFGDASPWFPGFSIYRQSLNGEWRPALDRLKRDLQVNYGPRTHSNPAELREI